MGLLPFRSQEKEGAMNLLKTIAELREERACLDEILMGLEKLSLKRTPRRGRPPAWSKVNGVSSRKNGSGLNGSTYELTHLVSAAKSAH
jgi:hypothetical protein